MTSTANALQKVTSGSLPIVKSTAQTIDAVKSAPAESPVIVDFDETLYLRNSTQDYLDTIYPRPAGAIFLMAARAVKPWRWFPASFRDKGISRDWFLVVAATILFPWTLLIWHWRAKGLAETYCNLPLARAIDLNEGSRVVIATLGFRWIVMPILRHMPIKALEERRCQLVSCRFFQGLADRRLGKLGMVTLLLGPIRVARSVVVTDSAIDSPLLSASSVPCLLSWPDAVYEPALRDVYLPLLYAEKVKSSSKGHFLRRVVMWHWAFAVLAYSWLSPHPVVNAVGLFLLTLSYWCVYEIGYQENDRMGEQYERTPNLSANFRRYNHRINLLTLWPWIWSIAFAIPGGVLVAISRQAIPLAESVGNWQSLLPVLAFDGGVWLAFLVTIRLLFWVYNRFNEAARMWIYPLLQIQRLFAFSLLVATDGVGAALLMSMVLSRWLQYCIYRCGGNRWLFPVNVGCTIVFVCLLTAQVIASPEPLSVLSWQAFAALAYCLIRSVKKMRTVLSRFDLVKRS